MDVPFNYHFYPLTLKILIILTSSGPESSLPTHSKTNSIAFKHSGIFANGVVLKFKGSQAILLLKARVDICRFAESVDDVSFPTVKVALNVKLQPRVH
jgi:hypothetical protein